ncbi:hypothetical protein JXA12_06025 [Candidatus Woesearchaeota archaeon]|nr:hypothetical protein [Candidatus Woesearchaeota archaeon]
MEIRIDTHKDSKEHIRHVIEFLRRFVGSEGAMAPGSSADGSSSGEAVEGMFGMFGDDTSPQRHEEYEEPEPRISLEPY